MNDLIRRQASIEIIKNYCENGCDYAEDNWCPSCQREKFVELLKALPSAQQWTPCSERLPDSWDERYLVSLAWGGVGTMEYKSTGFHNYGSFSPVPIETVTAWMPLPEPYKGEES